MNGFIRTAGMAAAVCSALICVSCGGSSSSSSSGGSSAGGGTLILCYTSTDTQKVTLSSVFPIHTTDPTMMVEQPWAIDFRRFLGQSGNEGGISVTCDQVTSKSAAKDKADALRKQGHDVVETTWAYAGG
jgi:hypothetical protein